MIVPYGLFLSLMNVERGGLMKTVKEVSELTGISVRTLHYYDEIGLLKPSKINESGYRLYDDASIDTLRHILLFKEIGFSLSDIKEIIQTPNFDKKSSLKRHKRLLLRKRDQINDLIWLLDRMIKGEEYMSLEDFRNNEIEDTMLESFRKCMDKYREYLIEYYGDEDLGEERYKKLIDENKDVILENVIRYYGSVSAYNEALSKGIDPDDVSKDYQKKVSDIVDKIAINKHMAMDSEQIQKFIDDWQKEIKRVFRVNTKSIISDVGNAYLNDENLITQTNKRYGKGTAEFIGKAIKFYCED